MTFVVIEAINKFIDQSNMNVNAYFTGVVMLSANSVLGIQRLASVIREIDRGTLEPLNRLLKLFYDTPTSGSFMLRFVHM